MSWHLVKGLVFWECCRKTLSTKGAQRFWSDHLYVKLPSAMSILSRFFVHLECDVLRSISGQNSILSLFQTSSKPHWRTTQGKDANVESLRPYFTIRLCPDFLLFKISQRARSWEGLFANPCGSWCWHCILPHLSHLNILPFVCLDTFLSVFSKACGYS